MKSTQVDSEERKDMEESTMFIENMLDLDCCTINKMPASIQDKRIKCMKDQMQVSNVDKDML